MTSIEHPTGRRAVDTELSDAVISYFSRGKSPYPRANPNAVIQIGTKRSAEELVAEVRALDLELGLLDVDWDALGFDGGCGLALATMTTRHPELSADALSTLDWQFSYCNR